ncbi:alpha/beta-hydrolase [Mycena vulgaris]|nr:alpha/beta-hydrolase [Mycena vulgaris]
MSVRALKHPQPDQNLRFRNDIALATLFAVPAASSRVVDLGYAAYQSNLSLEEGVTSFLGIRYAAPPVGAMRWMAPQAPARVSGVHNATVAPRQCFQAAGLTGSAGTAVTNRFRDFRSSGLSPNLRHAGKGKRETDGISDEDCLFLNVHVPTAPKTRALLPVIVYFHGGGYDAGNISLYPTQDFVNLSNGGVVAVSVQYRLGLFGFLAGKKIKEDGNLNAGLLDQNFALQWVQKYIAYFGGDPAKVTIWGQSAGAGSVLQHLVAHGGKTAPPLFRAALANSPFLPFQYHYDDPIPETLYDDVVSQSGCAHATDTLRCLRSAPATVLLNADTQIGLASFMGTYTFVPVVDGTFIVERPSVTFNHGRANGNALLVTTNSDEGAAFFVFPNVLDANNFTLVEYITQLFPRLPNAHINDAARIYSRLGQAVSDQATKVMGESIFGCPAYWMVGAFGNTGWKAEFAIPPGLHAEDLSYEFSTFAIPPTFTDPAFLDAYRQSFLSTAIALNPNFHSQSSLLPRWSGWRTAHGEMLFNETVTGAPVVRTLTTDAKLLQRCAFWNEVSTYTSQ